MIGNQSRLQLVDAFGDWRQVCADSKVERHRQEMTQQQAILQKRLEDSLRKAMAAMMGGAANVVIRNTWMVWKNHNTDIRKERDSERRVMTMLGGNITRVLLSTSFSGWEKIVTEV